jgi:hypothetical protein
MSHKRYVTDLIEKCGFEGSKTLSLTPLPPGIVATRSDREVSEEDGNMNSKNWILNVLGPLVSYMRCHSCRLTANFLAKITGGGLTIS